MSDGKVTQEDENKLKACVEKLVGGKIVSMTRQVRWRPSWFVDVEKNGEIIKLYVRGDRQSDVVPFPELKREADILRVMGENGVPAPHIYGMCEDPVAIVMECSPGTRDVAEAANDEERKSVARQYIEAMVKLHQLPLELFVDIGVHEPKGAKEIALAGMEAYWPLYEKHKVAPDPFIEFAIQWLRTNYPQHRNKASFIAFDAGQFMFEAGKLTTLYDFEFAMIGDPMTDLATMAMRHSHEPTGEDIDVLSRYYGELTGEPVEEKVVRYHHALFSTVACMQFIGTVANPKPGDPHDVYLEWSLALRRTLINALAENMDVTLKRPAPLESGESKNSSLYSMLDDMISNIGVLDEISAATRTSASNLVEYAKEVDRYDTELSRLALADAAPFVGKCHSMMEMEEKLEQFVQQADNDNNEALLQLFYNHIERQVEAYGHTTIGRSAAHIRVEHFG